MTEPLSVDDAFKILGVAETAEHDEITKAYHQLSRQFHPDANGGDGEKQAQINEAYEVALSNRRGLMPLEVRRAITTLERGLVSQRAHMDADQLVRSAIRLQTTPWQQLKYVSLIMGGFAAFFGWFAKDATPFLHLLDPFEGDGIRLMAIMLAATAGSLQFIVKYVENSIESFKDALGDEGYCLEILEHSLKDCSETSEFSTNDLHARRRSLLSKLPSPPPLSEDDRKLVALKALEHGLIEKVPENRTRYRFTSYGLRRLNDAKNSP